MSAKHKSKPPQLNAQGEIRYLVSFPRIPAEFWQRSSRTTPTSSLIFRLWPAKSASWNRKLRNTGTDLSYCCKAYQLTRSYLSLVLSTLHEALAQEPDRKCFRLIGGVLVERTVKDVVPALQTNQEGVRESVYVTPVLAQANGLLQIRKVVSGLTDQYKTKEEDFESFKREYNIRPAT